ncbi:O-antigen ligase family protein [bacterium]|nr:O-antigen ligase family protein [bacterium]
MVSHILPWMLLTNILIISSITLVVIDKEIKSKALNLVKNKLFWVALIPFLIYFTSLINSTDLNFGLKEIEKKLSLLVFPIIFGLTPFGKKEISYFLKTMIATIILGCILGFLNQLPIYLDTGDSGWLYNDNLSSIMNKQAVYYSFFINTAFLSLIYLFKENQLHTKLEKYIAIASIPILFVTQYFLTCRTALITSTIIIVGFILWLISKEIKQKAQKTIIIIISLILIASFFTIPKVLKRFESITNIEYSYSNPNPLNHFNGEIKKENWNGLNTRLAIWSCVVEEISKNPIIGTGIGDLQNNLRQNYSEKKFTLAQEANYNSHNQFLDVLLSGGILGLFLFIIYFYQIFKLSINNSNYLLTFFAIIFITASLTENILSRNQGVVFVSLLLSILIFSKKLNQNKI